MALETSQATQQDSITEFMFQGRVEKCNVTRGASVLETKSLVSQNHQPEASELGKPPPLSEQAALTPLRLAHINSY